jgi:hypothetical protein
MIGFLSLLSQEYLQTVERTDGEETGENRGWREQRLKAEENIGWREQRGKRTEEGENRPREEREERQREKKQRWTHLEKLNFKKPQVDRRDALLCYLLGSFQKLWKFATPLLFESAYKRVIIFKLVLTTPDLSGKT